MLIELIVYLLNIWCKANQYAPFYKACKINLDYFINLAIYNL